MTQKELLDVIEKAVRDEETSLDLSSSELTSLPAEIGQLTALTQLNLRDNRLTSLPAEIGQLTALTQLNLRDNRLTSLPAEIGQLMALTQLDLMRNYLTSLPAEIGQLMALTQLDLMQNHLTSLLAEIGQLTALTQLDLRNNHLTSLPAEIGQLMALTQLNLMQNHLMSLPTEIGQLTALTQLNLWDNRLTSLPAEIGQLTALTQLDFRDNRLTSLPAEIGQLTALTQLDLRNNHLTSLPAEIGQLTALTQLDLRDNHLTSLLAEIGQLMALTQLDLEENQLSSPPPDIIDQGIEAILSYLREQLEESTQQWVSKLLVVGEGGVGKTSLLRALRGEKFDIQESTTRGIDIRSLELNHPTAAHVTMQLNTWDFGGQEIYHATHQFFLTNRSLFLLAWNARHGFEQGKLYYWLDTIQALAPDSPILLVATHTDQRDADLPLSELRRQYPQIAAHCEVSNQTGRGIEELRKEIRTVAADLPLMGEVWPAAWLDTANVVRAKSEKYISPQQLWDLMAGHHVTGTSAATLAQWLHELGDILYFRDAEELNDIVILKPQWVTSYISKVLESEEVIEQVGIFTRAHMDSLWHDIDPSMRAHFLRLMERFDLSYRTLENKEISLVVERLPLDQPSYEEIWNAPKAAEDCNEIAMKFELNTIPAGIPTWFIARSHRFTTRTHWRSGAVFAYEHERKHVALVEASSRDRSLNLAVRGPIPQNFFALLKDGIEVILNRFPGLQIKRLIPCPGHAGEPCSHEFDYEQLRKRVNKKPTIECPESLKDVQVNGLLFGLHQSTQDIVLSRIDALEATQTERHQETLSAIENLQALTQREFTNVYRREQAKIESHCPNIFTLSLTNASHSYDFLQDVWEALGGQQVEIQLFCQTPGKWHPAEEGQYTIKSPAEWMKTVAPYVRRLISVLRYAAPLVGPGLGVAIPKDYEKHFKNDVKFMTKLVEKVPDIKENLALERAGAVGEAADMTRAEGAALRALRLLLDELDPQQHWGGLKKMLTPVRTLSVAV